MAVLGAAYYRTAAALTPRCVFGWSTRESATTTCVTPCARVAALLPQFSRCRYTQRDVIIECTILSGAIVVISLKYSRRHSTRGDVTATWVPPCGITTAQPPMYAWYGPAREVTCATSCQSAAALSSNGARCRSARIYMAAACGTSCWIAMTLSLKDVLCCFTREDPIVAYALPFGTLVDLSSMRACCCLNQRGVTELLVALFGTTVVLSLNSARCHSTGGGGTKEGVAPCKSAAVVSWKCAWYRLIWWDVAIVCAALLGPVAALSSKGALYPWTRGNVAVATTVWCGSAAAPSFELTDSHCRPAFGAPATLNGQFIQPLSGYCDLQSPALMLSTFRASPLICGCIGHVSVITGASVLAPLPLISTQGHRYQARAASCYSYKFGTGPAQRACLVSTVRLVWLRFCVDWGTGLALAPNRLGYQFVACSVSTWTPAHRQLRIDSDAGSVLALQRGGYCLGVCSVSTRLLIWHLPCTVSDTGAFALNRHWHWCSARFGSTRILARRPGLPCIDWDTVSAPALHRSGYLGTGLAMLMVLVSDPSPLRIGSNTGLVPVPYRPRYWPGGCSVPILAQRLSRIDLYSEIAPNLHRLGCRLGASSAWPEIPAHCLSGPVAASELARGSVTVSESVDGPAAGFDQAQHQWLIARARPGLTGPGHRNQRSHDTPINWFLFRHSIVGEMTAIDGPGAALVLNLWIEKLLFIGIFIQVLVFHYNFAENFFRRYPLLSRSSVTARRFPHWSVWFWREIKLLQLALLLLCTALRAGDALLDQTLHRLLILSVISNMTDRRMPAKADAKKFRFNREESPEIEAGVDPAGAGASTGQQAKSSSRRSAAKKAPAGAGSAATGEAKVSEEVIRRQEREKALLDMAAHFLHKLFPWVSEQFFQFAFLYLQFTIHHCYCRNFSLFFRISHANHRSHRRSEGLRREIVKFQLKVLISCIVLRPRP